MLPLTTTVALCDRSPRNRIVTHQQTADSDLAHKERVGVLVLLSLVYRQPTLHIDKNIRGTL